MKLLSGLGNEAAARVLGLAIARPVRLLGGGRAGITVFRGRRIGRGSYAGWFWFFLGGGERGASAGLVGGCGDLGSA